MNFPTTGYVVSVTHLDTYIDVRTQVATEKNRYCAALLIGHTNYQIRIGDLLSWNDNREVLWYPAEEQLPETWKITPRKLWLVRILSRGDLFGMSEGPSGRKTDSIPGSSPSS